MHPSPRLPSVVRDTCLDTPCANGDAFDADCDGGVRDGLDMHGCAAWHVNTVMHWTRRDGCCYFESVVLSYGGDCGDGGGFDACADVFQLPLLIQGPY